MSFTARVAVSGAVVAVWVLGITLVVILAVVATGLAAIVCCDVVVAVDGSGHEMLGCRSRRGAVC